MLSKGHGLAVDYWYAHVNRAVSACFNSTLFSFHVGLSAFLSMKCLIVGVFLYVFFDKVFDIT